MNTLLSVGGASAVSLIALLTIALWIRWLAINVRRMREHTLRPLQVTRTEEAGLLASFATILASLLMMNALVGKAQHTGVLAWFGIMAGVFTVLWIVLWGLTFWLRYQSREYSYVYLLPQDAGKVRRQHCRYGMVLLASMYPTVFVNRDVLDTFSRATEVSARLEVAPQWKRERWDLTNDFGVYCNVASEGYQQGYLGLLQACQEAPDELEAVRAVLKAWPDTPESQQAMEHWVTQFMGPERHADTSGGVA